MARIDAHARSRPSASGSTPADVVEAAAAHVRMRSRADLAHRRRRDPPRSEIDPSLTSAALAHLLENAGQYSPPGSPIPVDVARGARRVRGLRSQTRGRPIRRARSHLFERFYRGRVRRAQSSFGTGMGLAITRGLLAAAGGRVWARTRGRGRAFHDCRSRRERVRPP